MTIVHQLSVLAVRGLFDGFCKSIGFEPGIAAADAATKFLSSRFTDHSAKLSDALSRANASAWRALELSLAGDSWWDKIKVTLARREDQMFREQVNAFLRTTPLGNLPSHPPEFRQQALRDLRAAQKAGVLSTGNLDPQDLAQKAGPFARFADPQALLNAEWQVLDEVGGTLREAGFATLAQFLALRPHGELPMLVVAVRYFFRRELENDPALSSALSFAKLEQLAAVQEAGYDALATAMQKSSARLEELLAGALAVLAQLNATVQETHGDVKDIKHALAEQNKTLDAMGQAVFRALATTGTAPGVPTKKEQDNRLEVLNTLLQTPHRELMPLWPIHQELCAKDPRFYVRLGAWYYQKGEVRDHKEMFIITLCLSSFEGHREVGLALVRKLPPYQVARVVDFIHGRKETRRKVVVEPLDPTKPKAKTRGPGGGKPAVKRRVVREVTGAFGLFRNVPRSLKTEIARYLHEREQAPERFDSAVLVARRSLKRLYTVLHIKPGERAQKVLFDNDPPEDSRLGVLKRLVKETDPNVQAHLVQKAKLPFRVAITVLSEKSPKALAVLIDRMSPPEVINNLGLLRRHGALDDPELRLQVDVKLEQAKKATRISSLKAAKALQAVDVGDELRTKLEEVADLRLKAKGRIRRSTALLIDKSGSLELAIDAGKHIAAMIATVCEKELFVYAFDTMAYAIEAKGTDWGAWQKAFAGINANGETSVGISLEVMRRKKLVVEQFIIVTDEEEYNTPFFVESFLKYRQELKVDPTICFVKVPDSSTKLEDQCRRAGLTYTVFEFTGDYYSLPNLVALLEPPSQVDLLMEIMDHPLPERKVAVSEE